MFIVTDGKRVMTTDEPRVALRMYGEMKSAADPGQEVRLFLGNPVEVKPCSDGGYEFDTSEEAQDRALTLSVLGTVPALTPNGESPAVEIFPIPRKN